MVRSIFRYELVQHLEGIFSKCEQGHPGYIQPTIRINDLISRILSSSPLPVNPPSTPCSLLGPGKFAMVCALAHAHLPWFNAPPVLLNRHGRATAVAFPQPYRHSGDLLTAPPPPSAPPRLPGAEPTLARRCRALLRRRRARAARTQELLSAISFGQHGSSAINPLNRCLKD